MNVSVADSKYIKILEESDEMRKVPTELQVEEQYEINAGVSLKERYFKKNGK